MKTDETRLAFRVVDDREPHHAERHRKPRSPRARRAVPARRRCNVCCKVRHCAGEFCPECHDVVTRISDIHWDAEDGFRPGVVSRLPEEYVRERRERVDELARRYEAGLPLFPGGARDRTEDDGEAQDEVERRLRLRDQEAAGGGEVG